MRTTHASTVDLDRVRPGDRLEAHQEGLMHYRGIVEETIPHLGVVWIRLAGGGERKMVSTDDFDLRPWAAPVPAGPLPAGPTGPGDR